jgi:hypothetical protein
MEQPPEKERFFSDFKNLIIDYLQNRLELVRLSAFEKMAKIIALLFSGMILTMLLFFSVLFISIMAGFYFSNLFQNTFYGFAIVAGFYLITFVVLLIYRKQLIEKFIINAVVKVLFEEEDEAK